MEEYFKTVGDYDPTSHEIHLDHQELKEIWTLYKQETTTQVKHLVSTSHILSYSTFCKLFNQAYSHVKIREYRSVRDRCSYYLILAFSYMLIYVTYY